MTTHERWMELALKEARLAAAKNEVPVGAIVVHKGMAIGKGFNQVETMKDPTAHAEMIALTAAAAHLESKWLKDCTLYVTLEPCPMCAGAIVLSRIPTLVFGSYDPKMGACGTLYAMTDDKRLNHRVHTIGGVLDGACGDLLKEFFKKKRGEKTS
ncbi:MAG TPA: tRNA adenosine(34) deaminase TadA [Bacteroidota bacterium]|nr:tRNA adenosine(34) deaminase TadA [Bacteroidota bacterium]